MDVKGKYNLIYLFVLFTDSVRRGSKHNNLHKVKKILLDKLYSNLFPKPHNTNMICAATTRHRTLFLCISICV